tara:strand:- start:3135 stop:3845 length:711 start_codon:yes stop_codon:yes gene_type:complete
MEIDDIKKINIVVSRYDEDLSWLTPFVSTFKITVYNKGSQLTNSNFNKVIKLPNVGRESHTILSHIVNNYDSLDQYLIFLQGKIDDLYPITFYHPKDYLPRLKKYQFSVGRLGMLGPLHWKDDLGIPYDKKYSKKWNNFNITRSSLGFRNFSKLLFPEIPWLIATSYGGCFAVSRERVLIHKKSFYEHLLYLMSQSTNPIEGHYLERLWCYMFTTNKLLNLSLIDIFKSKYEKIIK